MSIQRYAEEYCAGMNVIGMRCKEDGDYVLFSDHEKEVTELKQKLAVAVEKLSGCVSIMDEFEYEIDEDSSVGTAFFEAKISTDSFFAAKHEAENIIKQLRGEA